MAGLKEALIEHLKQNEFKYEEHDDDVRLFFKCNNIAEMRIIALFTPDDDEQLQLFTYDVGCKVPAKKTKKVLFTCNRLNLEYGWVKFSLDDENFICMELDAFVSTETIGTVCMRYIGLMQEIGDEAHPILMKAIWG